MSSKNKYAWVWTIKEECIDDYVKMHLDPWPEVVEAHNSAGIRNYSIFQNGNQFFYCFECDDVDRAFSYLATNDVCQKWNSITSKMVDGSFDFSKETPVEFLSEVFFIE